MRVATVALSLALFTAGAAAGAPRPHAKPAPPPPAPSAWAIDKAASRVDFTASMNGQAINGGFKRWDAQIVFDPANLPASHVTATIDTASAATGDQTRDEALPTPDWFGSKLFAPAGFTSRGFKALGQDRYEAMGDLRIRNVTRPVSFPFTLQIVGDGAKMVGALNLDRTAFGVGQGQFKGTEAVAAAVQVRLTIQAKRAR